MTMAKNLLGSCGGVVVDAGDLSALQVGPSLAPPLHGPKELGIALHVIDDGVGGGGGGGVGVDEVSGATILTLKWRWRLHLSPMKRPEGSGRMTPASPRGRSPFSSSPPDADDGGRCFELPSHTKRLGDGPRQRLQPASGPLAD